MGCAVSGNSSAKLRDAREQVEELRRRLDVAQAEREKLQLQVEALEKERSEQPAREALVKAQSEKPVREAWDEVQNEQLVREASPGEAAAVDEARAPSLEASEAVSVVERGGEEEEEEPSPASAEVPAPAVGIVPLPAVAEAADSREESPVPVFYHNSSEQPPEDCILPGELPPYVDCAVKSSCVSPRTPSIVQSGELSEVSDSAAEAAQNTPKAWLQSPGRDASGKLTHSMDSRASTCTPGSQKVRDSLRCHQCACDGLELFQDPSDLNNYCERCWIDFYGQAPQRCEIQPLVLVEVFEIWQDSQLAQLWASQVLPGWPPPLAQPPPAPPSGTEGEVWSKVCVRVRRDVVGPHARDQTGRETLGAGEVLAGKYRINSLVGQGHFTKAYLAEDMTNGGTICLKRHRNLTVEALSDLMVIGHRMEEVDAGGQLFPRMLDAFYDYVCFTVESLVEGQNCLSLAQSLPGFFVDLGNLRLVGQGVLHGLSHLGRAGIVHNDVKPDNLMWVGDTAVCGDLSARSAEGPKVKIVDFGCARLDQREESGRNWSLAEGGAGHLGKWSPEMALRLPISHQGDVWGMAISLCELHCGRCVWRHEADTAEVVLAQSIGLCDLRDGLPSSLLRRSPLDVRQLYTPAPRHFPVRRNALGQLEALRPSRWGLEQVLGEDWREAGKSELRGLLLHALVVDPAIRPSAAQLLECCRFVGSRSREQGAAERPPL